MSKVARVAIVERLYGKVRVQKMSRVPRMAKVTRVVRVASVVGVVRVVSKGGEGDDSGRLVRVARV